MKSKKVIQRLLILMLSLLVGVGFSVGEVRAQAESDTTLTIIKLKNSQGTADRHETDPIAGSFYTLVKLSDAQSLSKEEQEVLEKKYADKSVAELTKEAFNNEVYHSDATATDGKTTLLHLTAGLYYGFEVDQKAGQNRVDASVPFVLLLSEGQSLTVYPKTPDVPAPDTTTYTVRKEWAGKKLARVTIRLKQGNKVIDTIDLSETNGWTHTFTNLAQTDDTGKDITYTAEEDVPQGYTATYKKMSDKNGLVITNTQTPGGRTPIIKTGTLGIYWLLGLAIVMIGLGYRLYRSEKN